jgi:hypothetical protein
MKYSIILSYRNRHDHLRIAIPKLRQRFPKGEIIVVEQKDSGKFRRGTLLNIGAQRSSGDVLVFHDVDYVPFESTVYYEQGFDCYLPVKFAEFVYNNFDPKPMEEIPAGYRHFRMGVDDNFFGAVTTFRRSAFEKINGFNTLYVGWGFEDSDLRDRVHYYNLATTRNQENYFFVLDHPDSGPAFTDQDFLDNIHRSQHSLDYLKYGLDTTVAKTADTAALVPEIDRWIQASEFEGPTNISATDFPLDEDDEADDQD